MTFEVRQDAAIGATLTGVDLRHAPDDLLQQLKRMVYERKIVIIRGQELSAEEYVAVGRRLGEVEAYYQPMYHHPQVKEVFVSSNVAEDGKAVGVPRTGKFWHADYEFMPRPFAFTLVHQRVVPTGPRGTYFIDMAAAWQRLPETLKVAVRGLVACHSPRRYFKIRPSDVYRPICDIMDEIERETPPARHPAVVKHPVTGQEILFVSEGLTYALETPDGEEMPPRLLKSLFEATGQLDATHSHPNIHLQTYDPGDLVMWDNRALVHCALHTPVPEPTVTWRVTLYDGLPFGEAVAPLAVAG
jgi:alpha-ketoglutarate-dependent taurine dioxygenase